ncbi:MAG TPA: hypothetical protein VMF69_11815 [Gemmataceae bacterium]|nr:hypothetical protein [Gemmataceae bacterium]
MDLKQKIRAAFTGSSLLRNAQVEIEPVAGRLLVYVVSPTFARKTGLQKQRLAMKILRATDTLSPEDMRRVGLVRTLTPDTYRRMKTLAAKRRDADGK